jgi:hypothetical protein
MTGFYGTPEDPCVDWWAVQTAADIDEAIGKEGV